MEKMIKTLEETDAPCVACNKPSKMKTFILQDSRPHKLITSVVCSGCGHSDTTQSDYDRLDYGVKITCDFSHTKDSDGKLGNENLNRMVFTNSGAIITVLEEEETLFEFTSNEPNTESVQGLLMRGGDILKYGKGDGKDGGTLDKTKTLLSSILKGGGFKMIIKDNSGFSKVCPLGREYTDVQDTPLEQLNDDCVKYEKIKKE